jgi:hypothetical protein
MAELHQNWPILALIVTLVGTSWFNREDIKTLRAEMNAGFSAVNGRIDKLAAEVHSVDSRLSYIEGRNSVKEA